MTPSESFDAAAAAINRIRSCRHHGCRTFVKTENQGGYQFTHKVVVDHRGACPLKETRT